MIHQTSASRAIGLRNLYMAIGILGLVLFSCAGCRKDETPVGADSKKDATPTTKPVNAAKSNELRTHSESLDGMNMVKRFGGGLTPGDAGPGDPVMYVHLDCRPVTDVDLARLSGWRTSLKELNLSKTKITDHGLQHLAVLKKLVGLDVSGTAITDEGLQHLILLPELTDLHMNSTAVTAKGLRNLLQMKKLRRVSLGGTSIVEEDIELLRDLPRMQDVSPFGPDVTAAWLTREPLVAIPWSTSKDGSVSLRLLLPVKTPLASEMSIQVYAELRNDSKKPLRLVRPFCEFLEPLRQITLIDHQGKAIPLNLRYHLDMGLDEKDITVLPPGRRIRDRRYVHLGIFKQPVPAGKYELRYTYLSHGRDDTWKGSITSAGAAVELK